MSKKSKNTKIIAMAMLMGLFAFGSSGHVHAAVTAKSLAEVSHMKQSVISELKNDSRVFNIDSKITVKKSKLSKQIWF